jgi:hypothetical protein
VVSLQLSDEGRKPYKAQSAANAAQAATATNQMLMLMLLQLRIGGFLSHLQRWLVVKVRLA